MTILVLGSINVDLTSYVPKLPAPGETLFGSSYVTGPGGKGFNQAAAAARLGAPTRFFGRIGNDAFGKSLPNLTKDEPVDMSGIIIDEDAGTGIAVISVDPQGENAIIVISGANMAHQQSDVEPLIAAMDEAKVLLLQLESPLAVSLTAARAARERGLIVLFDPAPAEPLPDEAFELATVMTPNELETETLVGFRPTNGEEAIRAGHMLRERGVEIAVVKLGAQGLAYVTEDSAEFVPSFKVDTIDTVAAGDAFNGGLAVALAEGLAIEKAVVWGAASGALATTKAGSTAAMPWRAELDALLATR